MFRPKDPKTDSSSLEQLQHRPVLFWGEDLLPRRAACIHFLAVGTTGSGKTTLVNRLLSGVMPSLEAVGSRALAYDPKSEMVPILQGLTGRQPKILNPIDHRCARWEVCEDIIDAAGAIQLAAALIPEREGGGNSSFFTDAGRDIVQGVITSLIRHEGSVQQWSLYDVLRIILYNPSQLRHVLDRNWDTRRLLEYISGDPELASNVRASMNAQLAKYMTIAAIWNEPRESFSLKRWIQSTGEILVMGNHEAYRATIDPLNALIFQRAAEEVLALEEPDAEVRDEARGLTWFVLDEIREAGKLDVLGRLMNKGRSKGAAVIMGIQDIAGLREVYGKDRADEIIAQFNNLAILRLNNPATAEWACELFGERELWERSYTDGDSNQGWNRSTQTKLEKSQYFLASEFTYLQPASTKHGLFAFYRHPFERPKRKPLNWDSLVKPLLPKRAQTPGYMKRLSPIPFGSDFTDADRVRLGIPADEDEPTTSTRDTQPPPDVSSRYQRVQETVDEQMREEQGPKQRP